jgi:hypothetical protein
MNALDAFRAIVAARGDGFHPELAARLFAEATKPNQPVAEISRYDTNQEFPITISLGDSLSASAV